MSTGLLIGILQQDVFSYFYSALRIRCVHAISLCLGLTPSCICFDLISIQFGSSHLSLFPAAPVNSCVRSGFSLQVWAVLAFLAFKDFPSRQSVLMHYYYYYYFKWCPLFSGFSRHLFGLLLQPEAPVVCLARHFHFNIQQYWWKKGISQTTQLNPFCDKTVDSFRYKNAKNLPGRLPLIGRAEIG